RRKPLRSTVSRGWSPFGVAAAEGGTRSRANAIVACTAAALRRRIRRILYLSRFTTGRRASPATPEPTSITFLGGSAPWHRADAANDASSETAYWSGPFTVDSPKKKRPDDPLGRSPGLLGGQQKP